MISFKQKGNFNKVETFFKRNLVLNYMSILETHAKEGVNALRIATPIDSGQTADSWYYKIERYLDSKTIVIYWLNSHVIDKVPLAILIQYGHGTKNGGYIQGIDFVNPTMKPIFERIMNDVWKEVIK